MGWGWGGDWGQPGWGLSSARHRARVRAGSKKKRAESLEASPLPLSAFYSSYGSFLLMHLIFGSVFRQALPASAELRIDWKDTGEKK